MSKDNLRIKICKSQWNKGKYNTRIGHIGEYIEHSNATKEQVLENIADEMENLKK
jgi:hypothetical protein